MRRLETWTMDMWYDKKSILSIRKTICLIFAHDLCGWNQFYFWADMKFLFEKNKWQKPLDNQH